MALSEVERHQQYLDKMIGEAEVLKPLVEECLDYDPAVRPTIATVYERVQVSKDAYMKECPQDVISLHQQYEQLKAENLLLRSENEQHKSTTGPLVMTAYTIISIYCLISLLYLVLWKEYTNTSR